MTTGTSAISLLRDAWGDTIAFFEEQKENAFWAIVIGSIFLCLSFRASSFLDFITCYVLALIVVSILSFITYLALMIIGRSIRKMRELPTKKPDRERQRVYLFGLIIGVLLFLTAASGGWGFWQQMAFGTPAPMHTQTPIATATFAPTNTSTPISTPTYTPAATPTIVIPECESRSYPTLSCLWKVRTGDNYVDIAKFAYGDPDYALVISNFNRDIYGYRSSVGGFLYLPPTSDIPNPKEPLFPTDDKYPGNYPICAPFGVKPCVYEVMPSDTYRKIAENYYAGVSAANCIKNANYLLIFENFKLLQENDLSGKTLILPKVKGQYC